jgi:cation diffusion facilitator family transporter
MKTSMSERGSANVIVIALFANLGIAISKFFGAAVSGSASLLAEAIHSTVDCANQVFLLVGSNKSKKPADEKHPLGYGREAFFWSFIVAILLFWLGGLFAIYEGVHKMQKPEDVSSPLLGLGILLFGILLESYSFWACLKEVRTKNIYGSLWAWFRKTKSSELLVIFTEDAAALTGLVVAAACLSMAWITGNPMWDALGSIMVGGILVIVAVLLGMEIKSFLIGEASSDELKQFVLKSIAQTFPDGKLLKFIAIQTGSDEIMMACKVHPGSVKDVDEAIAQINRLEQLNKAQFASLRWQFIELDKFD